jgi:tryptophan-rich sensory protein
VTPSPNSSPSDPPTARSTAINVLGLGVFIILCFAAAGLGAAVTSSSVGGWYQTLRKPTATPPDWVFGPVWTALFLLMAISAWLVWKQETWRNSRGPLALFVLQLALNVAWSAIFFGLRNPGFAFAEIIVLWLAIAATAIVFRRRSPLAGALLLPYLAWSTFAAWLNFAIWRMNG